MMISNTGGLSPLRPAKQSPPRTPSASVHAQFDRVEFSTPPQPSFHLQLTTRISQEVRAAKAEDLSALAEQIQNGSYPLDISALAKRILYYDGGTQV